MSASQILNEKDIDRILTRMSHEIIERPDFKPEQITLIGIHTRGVYLAERIAKKIEQIENIQLPLGTLDISFHRDDLNHRSKLPSVGTTQVPSPIEEKNVILIDDVLYTGRTVRAALDEIMDFGRPACIRLAVLIDRGHRELPIKADFVGKNLPTHDQDSVKVYLNECDDHDGVTLLCQ